MLGSFPRTIVVVLFEHRGLCQRGRLWQGGVAGWSYGVYQPLQAWTPIWGAKQCLPGRRWPWKDLSAQAGSRLCWLWWYFGWYRDCHRHHHHYCLNIHHYHITKRGEGVDKLLEGWCWILCGQIVSLQQRNGNSVIMNELSALNFSKPNFRTLNCPMLRDMMLIVDDNARPPKVMLVAASGPLALTAVETKWR